jgi:hypothetical protein
MPASRRGALIDKPNPITGAKQTALKYTKNPGEPINQMLQKQRDRTAQRARELRNRARIGAITASNPLLRNLIARSQARVRNSEAKQYITRQKLAEGKIKRELRENY